MSRATRRPRSLLMAALGASLIAWSLAAPAYGAASGPGACTPDTAGGAGLRGVDGLLREPVLRGSVAQETPAAARGTATSRFSRRIDVHFHVVMNSAGDGAVSDRVLNDQITYQNRAFAGRLGGAPAGFEFRLKSVTRTTRNAWFNAGPETSQEAAMKRALKRGGPQDLNVYTTSGNIYLGWAYFPDIVGTELEILDGVVIDFRSLPGGEYGSQFSLGGTLTHETGHWLGLLHTFDGGCGTRGDLVSDTPAEREPTAGCPQGKDTCPQKAGLDPIHNFMDYSFDSCYTQFTAGQAERMQEQWNGFRTP